MRGRCVFGSLCCVLAMQTVFERMGLYELTAMRTTLLRGIVATKYSTPAERETWRLQVDAITAELTRRNELKS
jgi:hypothetical protein